MDERTPLVPRPEVARFALDIENRKRVSERFTRQPASPLACSNRLHEAVAALGKGIAKGRAEGVTVSEYARAVRAGCADVAAYAMALAEAVELHGS